MFLIFCVSFYCYKSKNSNLGRIKFHDSIYEKYKYLEKYNYFNGKTESEYWEGGCFNLDKSYSLFKTNYCDGSKKNNHKKLFIIGDSHSAYLSLFLREYAMQKNITYFSILWQIVCLYHY